MDDSRMTRSISKMADLDVSSQNIEIVPSGTRIGKKEAIEKRFAVIFARTTSFPAERINMHAKYPVKTLLIPLEASVRVSFDTKASAETWAIFMHFSESNTSD